MNENASWNATSGASGGVDGAAMVRCLMTPSARRRCRTIHLGARSVRVAVASGFFGVVPVHLGSSTGADIVVAVGRPEQDHVEVGMLGSLAEGAGIGRIAGADGPENHSRVVFVEAADTVEKHRKVSKPEVVCCCRTATASATAVAGMDVAVADKVSGRVVL